MTELASLVRTIARYQYARLGTVRADVEDAVQEALLAIHLKSHTWKEGQPLGAWVRAIVRYKLIDMARRHGRRHEVEWDDDYDVGIAEDDAPSLSEGQLDELLAQASERQQFIIRALIYDDVPMKDIATRLDISEGTARVDLHRALKLLARAYQRWRT